MRVLLLALIAAAGCGNGGDTSGDAAHQACVARANMYRAQNGRAALVVTDTIAAFADDGAANDDSASRPHDHFLNTSGGGIAFAENECQNWDLQFGNGDPAMTAEACVDAWYAGGPGEGHYENLLGGYTTTACGIYVNGTDITILEDFGN